MMKVINKKPPPGANATDAGNRNPDGSIALPNVAGGPTAAPVNGLTGAGQLADTDVAPAPGGEGQLVAFDVFETKDPFRPQVSSAEATTDASSSAAPTAGAPAETQTQAPVTPTPPASTMSAVPSTPPAPEPEAQSSPVSPASASTAQASTTTATTTTAAPAQTVSISVNGAVSRVGSAGTFPSGKPVFRLVSWKHGEARIGIVGGSYSTGDPTLKLEVGKSVTLQNTSDGARYKLILLSTP
jgi:hypothetical protein